MAQSGHSHIHALRMMLDRAVNHRGEGPDLSVLGCCRFGVDALPSARRMRRSRLTLELATHENSLKGNTAGKARI